MYRSELETNASFKRKKIDRYPIYIFFVVYYYTIISILSKKV
jgi:hypothetical protein